MIVSDNVWMDVLVFSALGLSVLSLGAALMCFSTMRKQAAINTALFQKLEKSLQVSESGAVGLGKRLVALEQQFSNSAESGQCQNQTSRPASSVHLDESLKDAMSLLNAGLSPEEVARRCGISKAEASLMKLMRAQSPEAA
ncbi:DUF2802 domain-containing protein [Pseudomaricurvus sp.]|uniref:DUF2802 domain-containing protein n=1 Tax=Pseudomaricurvus sp. TaxID=2004510 RepID=UPI003F6A5BCB